MLLWRLLAPDVRGLDKRARALLAAAGLIPYVVQAHDKLAYAAQLSSALRLVIYDRTKFNLEAGWVDSVDVELIVEAAEVVVQLNPAATSGALPELPDLYSTLAKKGFVDDALRDRIAVLGHLVGLPAPLAERSAALQRWATSREPAIVEALRFHIPRAPEDVVRIIVGYRGTAPDPLDSTEMLSVLAADRVPPEREGLRARVKEFLRRKK